MKDNSEKNKICHITSAHSRYDIRIFTKECVSLAQNGYDTTLLVNDDNENEIVDNVKIISTGFKPKNRINRFFSAGRNIYKKALEINADIYHLHDPDLIPLGNKLKIKSKKIIFDSHEDVPQQIMDKQWIPKVIRGYISKLYQAYEARSIREYDGVISVTPHVVDRLSRLNNNTVMVTNYPIVDPTEDMVRKTEAAVCFAGGISKQWNHDKILQAIDQIEGVKYILAGGGAKDYMDMLKLLPGWSKVEYLGKLPHSEVKDIYSRAIAGMALNYSIQAKEEGTLGNTKIFEFMEAKLPVICSGYKLWKSIINENKCGICVDPNNIEEIAKAIEFILNNPKDAEIMGENGRKAVIKEYNWKTQEEVLLQLYSKLK